MHWNICLQMRDDFVWPNKWRSSANIKFAVLGLIDYNCCLTFSRLYTDQEHKFLDRTAWCQCKKAYITFLLAGNTNEPTLISTIHNLHNKPENKIQISIEQACRFSKIEQINNADIPCGFFLEILGLFPTKCQNLLWAVFFFLSVDPA